MCEDEMSVTAIGEYPIPRVLPCGETAVSIELGNVIDRTVNRKVNLLYRRIKASELPGIVDLIPTYRSLFILYDPWLCSYERLLSAVEECLGFPCASGEEEMRMVEIPVCYGGELGPDLDAVAALHNLDVQETIELHCAPIYHVYMIGFTPGFPYLGGLDERLYTPRREEPRKKVPPGSVGIADKQTGIYSVESPGGWHLLGRTPLRMFDLNRDRPFFLEPGDAVKFEPIAEEEFWKLSEF